MLPIQRSWKYLDCDRRHVVLMVGLILIHLIESAVYAGHAEIQRLSYKTQQDVQMKLS